MGKFVLVTRLAARDLRHCSPWPALVAAVTLSAWWLIATVLGTIATVAAITAIPAWLGARRPAARCAARDARPALAQNRLGVYVPTVRGSLGSHVINAFNRLGVTSRKPLPTEY